MVLRKCPACKDTVGAESDICPRCGASFRGAIVRRAVFWTALATFAAWSVAHYVVKLI